MLGRKKSPTNAAAVAIKPMKCSDEKKTAVRKGLAEGTDLARGTRALSVWTASLPACCESDMISQAGSPSPHDLQDTR
jgi:hypothetical protein